MNWIPGLLIVLTIALIIEIIDNNHGGTTQL